MKKVLLILTSFLTILSAVVSCQKDDINVLSNMSISILPDFSDGSVYSFSDDGSFFLKVVVTPEKYLNEFSNDGRYIYTADFRSTASKNVSESDDFVVVGELSSVSEDEGFMTVYFLFTKEEMDLLKAKAYTVSFSIKDKECTCGVSTSFVPMNNPRGGYGGDHLIQYDDPVGTIGMIEGVEGIVVDLPALEKRDIPSMLDAELFSLPIPAKKIVIATKNYGANTPEDYGSYIKGDCNPRIGSWRLPEFVNLLALIKIQTKCWENGGYKWTFPNTDNYLFLPAAGEKGTPGDLGLYWPIDDQVVTTMGGEIRMCVLSFSREFCMLDFPIPTSAYEFSGRLVHDMPTK